MLEQCGPETLLGDLGPVSVSQLSTTWSIGMRIKEKGRNHVHHLEPLEGTVGHKYE